MRIFIRTIGLVVLAISLTACGSPLPAPKADALLAAPAMDIARSPDLECGTDAIGIDDGIGGTGCQQN